MDNKKQPESFLADVAEHAMAVMQDNGVYRHLRFRKPGSSNMWFDLITWPGSLVISGDMGTWAFSRVEDMFAFFRSWDRENANISSTRENAHVPMSPEITRLPGQVMRSN